MNNPTYASASLYVGDLSPEVTETQLFEIFKQVGPVASIRVCRDAITRRSLGYAYVNYHNLQDAERAVDLMNFSDIKGKQCRIMWSQRDPQMRKSGVGNLFVKNVDKKVDNKTFYDLFSSYGNILSCKIATDENGNSKGFGFVHFETNEAAEKAINDLNGKDMWSKKLYVGFFIKDRKVDEETKKKYTNVFIKNLSKTVSDEKLAEIFGKFGKITNCVVMKEADGSSKGFAFVNFENTEDAQKAVEEINGKDIEGQTIYAGRAQKKAERERELRDMFERIKRDRMSKYQGVNLYVKNLDEGVDDEKLRQEFSVCGTITSTKIMRDDKGVSKGFGFVCYSTPEEATKSVTEMNGKMINDKQIYVALAQRKDLRRQHLEAQYAQRAAGIRLQQQAQATGMTGHPLYATGAPVFYGQRPGFVYQGQMMPRGRFAAPMQAFPGYAAPQQQRSQRGRSNKGGRGGHVGGRKQGGYTGIKYNPNVRNQPAAQAAAPAQPAVPAQPVATPEMSINEIGEKLFNLISSSHDATLAGKITGMLLDAYNLQELVGFLNNKEVLNRKVSEAIEVLDVYAQKQEGEATN